MSYIDGNKYGLPYGTVFKVNSYTNGTTKVIVEDADGIVYNISMGSFKYERLGILKKGDSVVNGNYDPDPKQVVEQDGIIFVDPFKE